MSFKDFFRHIVYLRLSSEQIIAQNVITGETCDEKNSIGVGSVSGRVYTVGDFPYFPLRENDKILFSKAIDLSFPTISFSKNTIAALRYFIRKLMPFFAAHPKAIIHITGIGRQLTSSEGLCLQKMGDAAGARETFIWGGDVLTVDQIVNKKFPGNHWLGQVLR